MPVDRDARDVRPLANGKDNILRPTIRRQPLRHWPLDRRCWGRSRFPLGESRSRLRLGRLLLRALSGEPLELVALPRRRFELACFPPLRGVEVEALIAHVR